MDSKLTDLTQLASLDTGDLIYIAKITAGGAGDTGESRSVNVGTMLGGYLSDTGPFLSDTGPYVTDTGRFSAGGASVDTGKFISDSGGNLGGAAYQDTGYWLSDTGQFTFGSSVDTGKFIADSGVSALAYALLDDTGQTTMRATLGLGGAAVQDTGYWLSDTGFALSDTGFALSDTGRFLSDTGKIIADSGISTLGRALIDDTGQTTMRATLGLGGAAVQDTGYWLNDTGQFLSDTGKIIADSGITALGRALLDDTGQTTMQATLGLGSAAVQDTGYWLSDTGQFTFGGSVDTGKFISDSGGDLGSAAYLDTGYWLVDTGFALSDTGFALSDTGFALSDTGQFMSTGTEIINLTPGADQNNYTLGAISPSKEVYSIVDIAPTASIKITGIETTGWETGKRFALRNSSDPSSASAYLIILERLSASSDTGNQFSTPNLTIPMLLMPGETLEFYFNGGALVITGGSRWAGGLFDRRMTTTGFHWGATDNGGSTSAFPLTNTLGNKMPAAQMITGTTAHGMAYVIDSYGREIYAGAYGAMAFVGSIYLNSGLATAGEDYRCFMGFTSHYLDSYDTGDGDYPLDMIAWRYDRARSVNWSSVTRTNGTPADTGAASANSSGVAAANQTMFTGGAFVNGDGSRVDFFYSNDSMQTWTFGTSHADTGTIPASAARGMGLNAGIFKIAGTASRDILVSNLGAIGIPQP
jgi:hypothetical protein